MTRSYEDERYWQIVERCLEELYGMAHKRARVEIETRAGSRSQGGAKDMTYHAPPLHVASNIAGEDRPMSDEMWDRYVEILKRFDLNPSGLEMSPDGRKNVGSSRFEETQQALATR